MNRFSTLFSALPAPLLASSRADRRRGRDERRSSQRLPVRVAVRQQVVSGGPSGPLLAQSSDLGLGGMRIWRRSTETDPDLPAHTEVELAFELPGCPDLLTVRGEVVFDEAQGEGPYRATGVRFHDLSEHEQGLLRDFLARNQPPRR